MTRDELRAVLEGALGAGEASERALEALVDAYGGSRVYIPSRRPLDVPAVRFAAYSGTPREEVCSAYAISERTLRRIVHDE